MAYLHCVLHGHPQHIALLWHWRFRHEVCTIRSWHGGKIFQLLEEVGQRIKWIGPSRRGGAPPPRSKSASSFGSVGPGSRSLSSSSSKSRGSINMSVPGTRCREGTAPSPAQYDIRYSIVYRIQSMLYRKLKMISYAIWSNEMRYRSCYISISYTKIRYSYYIVYDIVYTTTI